ncbi:MAG: GNAT family N-acetyltransferase [Candidatus Aadella gelida]|nr:GNAT family N-acetyltransferase [Candidatus Aadella gelida]
MNCEICELYTPEEIKESFSVVKELRTHLSESEYLDVADEMLARGYRLLALKYKGEMVTVAGIEVSMNLYHGRHIWVYDLVTAEKYRSKSYGEKMLKYIEDMARKEGCGIVSLASKFEREGAHRFYEDKMGYEKTGFVFQKKL